MAVYPDDVVVTIIKELKDDRTTLVNLARTCKHFYALTEPYRFRKIHLRNEFDAFLLHEHFKKKDSLRHMVDTLVIAPKKNGQVQDFWLLEQAITKLPRLQNLFIRFPNKPIARYYRDFFYVRRWTDNLAFTALRSCTLAFRKRSYRYAPRGRPVDNFVPIFCLPTLEELNLVGARLGEIVPFDMKTTTVSRLTTLRLENCYAYDIEETYLRPLLSIPKALETCSFSIDPNSFYSPDPPEYDDVEEPEFMQIFLENLYKTQGDTLTSLELKFNYTKILGSRTEYDTPSDLFMRWLASMFKLKHFELGLRMWEWNDCNCRWPNDLDLELGRHRTQIHYFLWTLPDGLESFKLRLVDVPGFPRTAMLYLCRTILQWKPAWVPKLGLFDLEYAENRDSADPACIQQRTQFEEAGEAFKKAGIQFRVHETVVEKARARSMVHGQHLARSVLVHDSYETRPLRGRHEKVALAEEWYHNCGEKINCNARHIGH